ncbi:MAG: DNA polymerase delta, subunit 4-domain-containing protein [Benniella sp.]|nr:MAG: DNA polymerase delta, subunit 4-domain-containing protein [Benniella sp.]
MTPPRKPTNTIDTTGNFFQRGKKPSTAHRVVTAKNVSSQKVAPAKKRPAADVDQEDHSKEDEVSDEIDDADYSDEDDGQLSVSDQDEAEHEEENEHVLIDEISSDDSDAEDLPQVRKTTAPRKSLITSSSSSAKKVEFIQPKAAKRASTRRNQKDTYVAPYVGDVHVGFHQADLSANEKALRQFDLASKYGPCTDLSRLERWERAFELGLNPPQEVKDMIIEHMSLNVPVFEGRV